MTELTMILCLIASPTECRETRTQFHAISPYTCATKAQGQISNPRNPLLREGEFVSKYHCKRAGVFAKI